MKEPNPTMGEGRSIPLHKHFFRAIHQISAAIAISFGGAGNELSTSPHTPPSRKMITKAALAFRVPLHAKNPLTSF